MSNFSILAVHHSWNMTARLGWKQVFKFSLLPNFSLLDLHPSLELCWSWGYSPPRQEPMSQPLDIYGFQARWRSWS